MPKFTCVSRDSGGNRITAIVEAESRQSLLTDLKGRGLTVVEIKEFSNGLASKAAAARAVRKARLIGGISTGEMAVFWRELATMVAAGLPVIDALESIGQELEHARMRKVLQAVIASLWEGFNLAQSLGKHPKVFSPMVVALIASAEESGSLPAVSQQLATYLENRDRIIQKVRAALTYPIFLCFFFLVVIAVATFWIIPQFRDIYTGFRAKLPWLTLTVFNINAFVLHYLAWIAAGTAAVLLVFALWATRPSGRAFLDRISLKMPLFGKLIQLAAVARFCRSLSILLSGGIPINRALEMSQETSGNRVISRAIMDSRDDILKGGKIAGSFKKQKIFPQMAVRMMAAGEETGSMGALLEKVADFYESRVDAALSTINALIEPVIIIVVGGFVLVFVLAMYLPIFNLAATMRA